MEAIGLSAGMFFEQFIVLILFLGLPIISLIDLAKRKLTGIPLAIWAVFICIVPLMGSIAYWIIQPTAEPR